MRGRAYHKADSARIFEFDRLILESEPVYFHFSSPSWIEVQHVILNRDITNPELDVRVSFFAHKRKLPNPRIILFRWDGIWRSIEYERLNAIVSYSQNLLSKEELEAGRVSAGDKNHDGVVDLISLRPQGSESFMYWRDLDYDGYYDRKLMYSWGSYDKPLVDRRIHLRVPQRK